MSKSNLKNTMVWAFVCSGLASGAAMAYEPFAMGGYVGGQYGALTVNDSDFDDDNDAYQLKVGANILPFLGVELGYNDFGRYGDTGAQLEVDGYSLAAVGRLPVTESLGLYAKAGQLWWDAEYNVLGFSGDTDEKDIFFGIGAELEMTENLDLIVAYDRFKIDVSNELTQFNSDGNYEADLNFASVGVNLTF